MDAARLAEIKARCDAAWAGPWLYWYDDYDFPPAVLWPGGRVCTAYDAGAARFIAHARTDVPDLVAEVERLKEAYRRLLDHLAPKGLDCEACKGTGEVYETTDVPGAGYAITCPHCEETIWRAAQALASGGRVLTAAEVAAAGLDPARAKEVP